MAASSGSERRMKGRSCFWANFWWEAVESLLTPMTTASRALKAS